MPDTHAFQRPPGAEPTPIDLDREHASDGSVATTRPGGGNPAESALPDPDQRRHGAPTRPSRRRMIVLGSVLVLGVAGTAAFGGPAWRVVQEKDAAIRTPPEVAGLTLDDGEQARATADYLRTGLAADIRLDESVGAVYTDPAAADRGVLLFGGTTLIWQPERDLDQLFGLVADDESEVTGLREMPAGQLGGVLKCGTTVTPEGDLAVCGWADHGSVALALFPGRGVDEAGALMREIRDETQRRD